jgi:hypothetical protein
LGPLSIQDPPGQFADLFPQALVVQGHPQDRPFMLTFGEAAHYPHLHPAARLQHQGGVAHGAGRRGQVEHLRPSLYQPRQGVFVGGGRGAGFGQGLHPEATRLGFEAPGQVHRHPVGRIIEEPPGALPQETDAVLQGRGQRRRGGNAGDVLLVGFGMGRVIGRPGKIGVSHQAEDHRNLFHHGGRQQEGRGAQHHQEPGVCLPHPLQSFPPLGSELRDPNHFHGAGLKFGLQSGRRLAHPQRVRGTDDDDGRLGAGAAAPGNQQRQSEKEAWQFSGFGVRFSVGKDQRHIYQGASDFMMG